MPPEFGTSGLRGLVADLSDETCASYARAFLAGLDHSGTLLVGRDLRPSSPRMVRAVAAGARSLGLDVESCGPVPTPALALEAGRRGLPAIMVTGSHIPANRNGLKFYTASGEITKAEEIAINARLEIWQGTPDLSDPPFSDSANSRYVARYTRHFAANALMNLRIGVYEHSAVGRDALGSLLRALGAEVIPLGRSETFVAVDTEAIDQETRTQLAVWARDTGCDAIVSLDGDSDRPLVTDAEGRVIPGDIIGALTARHLGARVVVTPVSSNTMIDAMGFEAIHRTRIGSPHVIAAMNGAGADRVVGYEANGGFLTGFDVNGTLPSLLTRDAFLPILCTLSDIARDGPLVDRIAALPPRRTATDRIKGLPTATSATLIATLCGNPEARADLFDLGPERHVDLTDGLRVTFASGEIAHLRPSGNAPELRCYAEAGTDYRAGQIVRRLLAAIAASHLAATRPVNARGSG